MAVAADVMELPLSKTQFKYIVVYMIYLSGGLNWSHSEQPKKSRDWLRISKVSFSGLHI